MVFSRNLSLFFLLVTELYRCIIEARRRRILGNCWIVSFNGFVSKVQSEVSEGSGFLITRIDLARNYLFLVFRNHLLALDNEVLLCP